MVSRLTEIVHPGGLAVALVGFGITRFVVAGTVQAQAMVPFVIAVVPLVVGLVFTVYGMVLAVGDLPEAYVDTVVRWTLLGVTTMAAVLGLTAIGTPEGSPNGVAMLQDSQLLVSNALLGGAVGGALTGDRAGSNRRHRNEIELQAELALIANGLLRHEVLNATAIIDGYASLFEEDEPRESDVAAIQTATERIERTVAAVGEVGRARDDDSLRAIGLGPILEEEIATLGEQYPQVTFTRSVPQGNVQVLADHRLRLLIRKVLELIVVRDPETTVTVEVTAAQYNVSLLVSVADDPSSEPGGGGKDDPAVDFDYRIVELLTDYYGGEFEGAFPEPTADRSASAVLRLPRATGERNAGGQIGVTPAGISAAILSGIAAGAVMGLLSETLAGLLPIIGSLYGVADPVVGWVTHLFHSVVFALLFAAGYAHLRGGTSEGTIVTRSLLGAGWGAILWLVAAGIIMPVWLRLVGVPTAVPNLTAIGLFTHVVWGVVLGSLYLPLRRRLETSERWDRLQAAVGLRVGRMFG